MFIRVFGVALLLGALGSSSMGQLVSARGVPAPEDLPVQPDVQQLGSLPPPSNDACASPAFIGCGMTLIADTFSASSEPTDQVHSCAGSTGFGTVWYRYVARNTGFIVSTSYPPGGALPGGIRPDTILNVYAEGPCGSLTSIVCNDNVGGPDPNTSLLSSVALGSVTPGTVYLFQVSARSVATMTAYAISVTGCAPPNDECTGATDLVCGVSALARVVAASSNPTDPVFGCRNAFACDTGLDPARGSGTVWFKFVASKPRARITTSASSPTVGNPVDTIVAVYSGVCGSLVQVACNDDIACSINNFFSELTVDDLVIGQTYYVQVAAWGDYALGNYNVLLECFTPNDECATPTRIQCGRTLRADTQSATTNFTDPAFNCRFGGPAGGVGTLWYSFIATQDGAVITTGPRPEAGSDTLLQIFAPGTCGSLIPIACNDDIDASGGNFLSSATVTGLIPGQEYLIQVAAWSSFFVGSYTITVDCFCTSNQACPLGSTFEPEFCGDDVNSGGFEASTGTSPITLGQIVCGRSPIRSDLSNDFDIYRFSITRPTVVYMALRTETLMDSGLLQDSTNEGVVIQLVVPCGETQYSAFLDAGTWRAGVVSINSIPGGGSCEAFNDEYTTAVFVGPGCPGDADGSGNVTFTDITAVLTSFGNDYRPFPALGPGDADSSGSVNFTDITSVLTNLGNSCNLPLVSPGGGPRSGDLRWPRLR